jgi:hypothetical protein
MQCRSILLSTFGSFISGGLMIRHRCLPHAVTVTIVLLWSSAAWAHDDDNVPMDPAVLLPGLKVFLVVAALFVVARVWYQLRKRAIVRAGKADEQRPS